MTVSVASLNRRMKEGYEAWLETVESLSQRHPRVQLVSPENRVRIYQELHARLIGSFQGLTIEDLDHFVPEDDFETAVIRRARQAVRDKYRLGKLLNEVAETVKSRYPDRACFKDAALAEESLALMQGLDKFVKGRGSLTEIILANDLSPSCFYSPHIRNTLGFLSVFAVVLVAGGLAATA